MTDQWLFKSETYDNCNCQINCGCQFNLPSTNGYCQSAYIGLDAGARAPVASYPKGKVMEPLLEFLNDEAW